MNRSLLPPALLNPLVVPPPALPGSGGTAATGNTFSRALSDARFSVEPQGAEAVMSRGGETAPPSVAPRESESAAPREADERNERNERGEDNERNERCEGDASGASTPPAATSPRPDDARRPGTPPGTPARPSSSSSSSSRSASGAAAADGDARAQGARARARAAAQGDDEALAPERLPRLRPLQGETDTPAVADARAAIELERQRAAPGADEAGAEIAGRGAQRGAWPANIVVATTALAGGQRNASAGTGATGAAAGIADALSRADDESAPGLSRLARVESTLLGAAAAGAPTGARVALADAASALAAAVGESGRSPTLELAAAADSGRAAAIRLQPGAMADAWGTVAVPGFAPAGMNSAAPAEATLASAPGSVGFARELGAQLSVFVREGVQQARLQLNPQDLGPVLVRIQLEGQAAQVHMSADLPLTRQALEQALPALAGQLSEAGITLTGGGVFEQPGNGFGAGERQPRGDESRRGSSGSVDDAREGAHLSTEPRPASWSRARGIVDLVA